MTHEDVIKFGEKYGISPSPKSTPASQRRSVEKGIARLVPGPREMSKLAVEQLLSKGGGPAVEYVIQKLESISHTNETTESQVTENLALHEAVVEARALIKDLWEAGAMDKQTIWSLADVLSLEHTMLQNLKRNQRIRLAQTTVAGLVDDLESAKQALRGQSTVKYGEYKRIIDYLNGAEAELPTLLEKSRNPSVAGKEVTRLSPEQQSEQYTEDLNCMVFTLRLTYLGNNYKSSTTTE